MGNSPETPVSDSGSEPGVNQVTPELAPSQEVGSAPTQAAASDATPAASEIDLQERFKAAQSQGGAAAGTPGVRTQPRELKALEEEHNKFAAAVGEAYLQRETHDFALKNLVNSHRNLVAEFTARQELDEKAVAEKLKAAEDKRKRKAEKAPAAAAAPLIPEVKPS